VNSEPVKIVYSYTRSEYIRAMRRHYKRNIDVYRDSILAVAVIVISGSMMYFSVANWIFDLFFMTLGVLLLLIVVYALLIIPVLIYRSDPRLKWEYSLTFYDDKIEFKTNEIDSTLQWPLYRSWLRDDEFYILYHGKRELSVIPRRALRYDNSDERLAELLQRRIGPPSHI
jgi:hypothetical protein